MEPVVTIREGIALMTSKWLWVLPVVVLLSGCVSKAKHPQCQDLKGEAFGAQLGAAASGRYLDQMRANIDQARYERCEEMFDLVQYQAQEQEQLQQAQAQAQERQRILVDRSKSPEMQKILRGASLGDLVGCEKAVTDTSDKHAPDVKAMSSYMCEKEIDRRVSAGIVSRGVVDKMLNQK